MGSQSDPNLKSESVSHLRVRAGSMRKNRFPTFSHPALGENGPAAKFLPPRKTLPPSTKHAAHLRRTHSTAGFGPACHYGRPRQTREIADGPRLYRHTHARLIPHPELDPDQGRRRKAATASSCRRTARAAEGRRRDPGGRRQWRPMRRVAGLLPRLAAVGAPGTGGLGGNRLRAGC